MVAVISNLILNKLYISLFGCHCEQVLIEYEDETVLIVRNSFDSISVLQCSAR